MLFNTFIPSLLILSRQQDAAHHSRRKEYAPSNTGFMQPIRRVFFRVNRVAFAITVQLYAKPVGKSRFRKIAFLWIIYKKTGQFYCRPTAAAAHFQADFTTAFRHGFLGKCLPIRFFERFRVLFRPCFYKIGIFMTDMETNFSAFKEIPKIVQSTESATAHLQKKSVFGGGRPKWRQFFAVFPL